MKYVIVLLFFSLIFINPTSSFSQIDLLKKVKKKVEKRVEKRTDEGIDKGLDEVEKGAKDSDKDKKTDENKSTKEKSSDNETTAETPKEVKSETAKEPAKETLKSFSKYDFVPGEKVIVYEDFSQDAVGDFPALWYTNGSGEVVTLNNFPGQWLMFRENSKYVFRLEEPLPDNYTVEFDLIRTTCETNRSWSIFHLASIDGSQNPYNSQFPGLRLDIHHSDVIRITNWGVDNFEKVDNRKNSDILKNYCNKPLKVSIWVQKQRMRLWINEEKIYDIPKFMPKNKTINTFIIESPNWSDKADFFSNLRIAAGAPDMRNKLLTEGKLVTHGILFDVNSDKIKPESYGTLKDIARVLQENADVKVKILGHTDSDGSDASNLELSKKRSASVKNALSTEFGIDASRMDTDGKGEAEPISDNNTTVGKANNRRVEFIKM